MPQSLTTSSLKVCAFYPSALRPNLEPNRFPSISPPKFRKRRPVTGKPIQNPTVSPPKKGSVHFVATNLPHTVQHEHVMNTFRHQIGGEWQAKPELDFLDFWTGLQVQFLDLQHKLTNFFWTSPIL